jgi:hypothetical protein
VDTCPGIFVLCWVFRCHATRRITSRISLDQSHFEVAHCHCVRLSWHTLSIVEVAHCDWVRQSYSHGLVQVGIISLFACWSYMCQKDLPIDHVRPLPSVVIVRLTVLTCSFFLRSLAVPAGSLLRHMLIHVSAAMHHCLWQDR